MLEGLEWLRYGTLPLSFGSARNSYCIDKMFKKDIQSIFGINLTLNSARFVLGVLSENIPNNNSRYLLRILLLIAKGKITVSRLKRPPRTVQWSENIKLVCAMK